MSIQALKYRATLWIRRPLGRLAALLLLVAMASAGLPTGAVHAHAGGDHDHDHGHSAQVEHDGASGLEEPAPAAPTDLVLHAHDVGTSFTALPIFTALIPGAVVAAAPGVDGPAPPPTAAVRIPPHRPPIA